MAHHHPHQENEGYGKAFALGVGLNLLYVGFEVTYGLTVGSSALLADAGHNASDVLSLLLAWAALRMAQRQPSQRFTYGLRKSTIMASLLNGMLIVAAAVLILWDAIGKLQDPQPIAGDVVMIVAAIGIAVNGGTALLFYKGQQSDLNIRGAFLHMAADTGVTLAVLLGGLIIRYSKAYWVDPALSFLIVGVILYSTWGLLRDSVKLALDAVPQNVNLPEVRHFLEALPPVAEVHDLHIWALSTRETALTAHLVIPTGVGDEFLFDTREQLKKKFGIHHTTLQIENSFADHEYRAKR